MHLPTFLYLSSQVPTWMLTENLECLNVFALLVIPIYNSIIKILWALATTCLSQPFGFFTFSGAVLLYSNTEMLIFLIEASQMIMTYSWFSDSHYYTREDHYAGEQRATAGLQDTNNNQILTKIKTFTFHMKIFTDI